MRQAASILSWGKSRFISSGCSKCRPPELCSECAEQLRYEIKSIGDAANGFDYDNSRGDNVKIKAAKRFSLLIYVPDQDDPFRHIYQGKETHGRLKQAVHEYLKETEYLDLVERICDYSVPPDTPIPAFTTLAVFLNAGSHEGHEIRIGSIYESVAGNSYHDMLRIETLAGAQIAFEIAQILTLFIEWRPKE